jgi:hypothetical protein
MILVSEFIFAPPHSGCQTVSNWATLRTAPGGALSSKLE